MESIAEKVYRLIPEVRLLVLTELWIQKFTGMSTQYMLETFHKKRCIVTIMKTDSRINFKSIPFSFRIIPTLWHGFLDKKCLVLTDNGTWVNKAI